MKAFETALLVFVGGFLKGILYVFECFLKGFVCFFEGYLKEILCVVEGFFKGINDNPKDTDGFPRILKVKPSGSLGNPMEV